MEWGLISPISNSMNCNGELVNMHSLACSQEAKALWIVGSAEWCGPCHIYADNAKLRLDSDGERGLILAEVIGQNANGEAPSHETCKNYADQHELSYQTTFIDPNWTTLWTHLYAYPYSNGAIGFPWVAILRGTNMEYVYNSQLTNALSDDEVLDSLLDE